MADEPEIAAEVVIVTSAEPVSKKRAKPATAKYEVINGAISPNGGGMEDLVHPGTIVELSTEMAIHYNKLGYLKPYIEA